MGHESGLEEQHEVDEGECQILYKVSDTKHHSKVSQQVTLEDARDLSADS